MSESLRSLYSILSTHCTSTVLLQRMWARRVHDSWNGEVEQKTKHLGSKQTDQDKGEAVVGRKPLDIKQSKYLSHFFIEDIFTENLAPGLQTWLTLKMKTGSSALKLIQKIKHENNKNQFE